MKTPAEYIIDPVILDTTMVAPALLKRPLSFHEPEEELPPKHACMQPITITLRKESGKEKGKGRALEEMPE